MPPMMFTDEEALGLSLGLVAARGLGLSGVTPAVEGALAKVEGVMPESLRRRLRALEQTVELTMAIPATLPDCEVVSALASAAGERRRVRLRYRSARGEETSRVVDPYAVLRREGRWHRRSWAMRWDATPPSSRGWQSAQEISGHLKKRQSAEICPGWRRCLPGQILKSSGDLFSDHRAEGWAGAFITRSLVARPSRQSTRGMMFSTSTLSRYSTAMFSRVSNRLSFR